MLLWWNVTGISICGTDCQALQVMDMKVYTGEISPYLKSQYKGPSLSTSSSLLQYINNNITCTEKEKNPYCTRLRPEVMIVSPLLWSLRLWPCYSCDSQPATCRISPLINCGTGCFDSFPPTPTHPSTPISLPSTIPHTIGCPERNQKEGGDAGKMASVNMLLTCCSRWPRS